MSEEDELDAIISGKKEAGAAPAPTPGTKDLTDDELDAIISGKNKPDGG
jgi:hypothetical protein